MALTVDFSVSQSYDSPSIITLTDTSTGSDGTITNRRIYLQKADGTYLVPTGTTTDYILWSYAVSFKEVDALDKDYGLYITVQWLNGSNTVVYTKAYYFDFPLYSKQFLYNLTLLQAGSPQLLNNPNFLRSKMELFTHVQSASNATELGDNINATQFCLNEAKKLMDNQSLFF